MRTIYTPKDKGNKKKLSAYLRNPIANYYRELKTKWEINRERYLRKTILLQG